jgi:hypothetical protein
MLASLITGSRGLLSGALPEGLDGCLPEGNIGGLDGSSIGGLPNGL